MWKYRSGVHRGVNSRRFFFAVLGVAGVLISTSQPGIAGEEEEPPLLLGGPQSHKRARPHLDPWLPTGAEVSRERPRASARSCSSIEPVCVHWVGVTRPESVLMASYLEALENAYRILVYVMRLPAPLGDQGGGSSALDLYLDETEPAPSLQVWPDELLRTPFDQAAASCLVHRGSAQDRDRAATLCVAESIALRLDSGVAPGVRRAYATHLWRARGGVSTGDLEEIDEAQAQPELGTFSREIQRGQAGGLFFDYLDQSRGVQGPGVLATALIALGANATPVDAFRFDNEPDVLDVLRSSLAYSPRKVADLWLDYAVARAFMGDRSDGAHRPGFAWSGSFGRVRFDWHMTLSSLPRRVLAARPIQPTGAIYLWLELDREHKKTLALQAQWEPPVAFHWAMVRLDKKGRELSRLKAPFMERGHGVEQRMVNTRGAAAILIVGINLGGVDASHPFDPDYAPFEPHKCTVYLTEVD